MDVGDVGLRVCRDRVTDWRPFATMPKLAAKLRRLVKARWMGSFIGSVSMGPP